MERAALPNMAPIVQETVLPRRTLLGIRPSEVDRHQTEPVPKLAISLNFDRSLGIYKNLT